MHSVEVTVEVYTTQGEEQRNFSSKQLSFSGFFLPFQYLRRFLYKEAYSRRELTPFARRVPQFKDLSCTTLRENIYIAHKRTHREKILLTV